MTQIKGFIPPTGRKDALGVHSLDHFNFPVPDLSVAETFYKAFGLDTRVEGSDLDLYTYGHSHRWGRITGGQEKRLGYLSFGIYEDDLERFHARLKQLNLQELDAPPGMESNSIWLRDRDGILLELKVAEKSSPDQKTVFSPHLSVGEGERGAPMRGETSYRVQPRRLAHCMIFVRDIAASIKFYQDALGLRLSDEAGGGVAFMHGIHGSDHHMVAFAKASAPGFHHCSWDVPSVEDVGTGAMDMAAHGYTAGWGLGRHVLGSNFFHYVRDPWGSYSEYSADIDYIPAAMEWEGKSHSAENSFYLWGPAPPADFATNHEALGL